MRSEMIKILEHIFTNESVPLEIKELGTQLMVEELAPDDMDSAQPFIAPFQMAAQTREGGSWVTRKNYLRACKYMAAGEKISAIKALRDNLVNKVGLAEAKHFVEDNEKEMLEEAKRYE
jgi:ribosomal protein L7/L12